jgi:hypothetical protein
MSIKQVRNIYLIIASKKKLVKVLWNILAMKLKLIIKIKTQNKEVDINEELRKLVERRILETRAKLDLSKFNQ